MAQPGSAPQWGCGGRRFKSSRPDHIQGPAVLPGLNNLPILLFVLACLFLVGCEQSHDPQQLFAEGHYEEAFNEWKRLADGGDAHSQQKLGMMYYLGLGVNRDFGKAMDWYRKAALAGNAQAQWNMGSMYASGLGVSENVILAYGWFHYADANGNTHAREYIQYLGAKLTPNQTMKGKEIVGDLLHEANSDK